MRRIALAVPAALAAGALAACASSYKPPSTTDPVVRDDAAALARVVEADQVAREQAAGGPVGRWTCTATLWGRDGAALLAEAECEATYRGGADDAGFVRPIRVEDDRVTYAADGSQLAGSLRRMWGPQLAEAYLDQ